MFDYTALNWKKINAVLNEVQITQSVQLIDNNRIVICELHKQKNYSDEICDVTLYADFRQFAGAVMFSYFDFTVVVIEIV